MNMEFITGVILGLLNAIVIMLFLLHLDNKKK